ncbi:MAG: hypothetical protein JWO94_2285 [Verrucomicrobiaceae bacterium]|nr:hypothetical protein [Verrucomicrobiaceae bacterium]
MKLLFLVIAAASLSFAQAQSNNPKVITRVPVVFSEGHETDGKDGGRPVVLVAGALGVPAEVFREAFTHVRPARAGEQPEEHQVRENKAALMKALGKYGVTNDKLDAASNYYRYVRSRGELWPTKPAVANAVVRDGVVTGIELINGGSGYTSPPVVTVPNIGGVTVKVELAYGKKLATNGSVSAITILQNREK